MIAKQNSLQTSHPYIPHKQLAGIAQQRIETQARGL